MHEQTNEEESKEEQQDTKNSPNTRWKEGDQVNFVRVRFPGNAKSFPFLYGKRNFQYGQKVVAMSDRGMTVGYINSFPYSVPFEPNMLPIKSIVRAATEEDIKEQKRNLDQEKRAEVLSNKYINELELDMNITHVEIIQFGKKAVIYFNAPSRVDFRALVKKLVADLKMRIELRQISVRDRSAAIGAIGACGLLTCCSGFLKNYGHVSIKLAKMQNLALIPSKINGVCGQLKCCITYEENVYSEKRKRLPNEGKYYQLKNGDRGKITKIHILIEQFEMLTDQGQFRRYSISQFDKNISLPKEWSFPERFDHITNETSKIIGLDEVSATVEHETPTFEKNNEELEVMENQEDGSSEEGSQPERTEKHNKNRNNNRNRNRNNRQNKEKTEENKNNKNRNRRNNKRRNNNKNRDVNKDKSST